MWTELIFGGLFVLHCAVCSSPPKPLNVSFSSVNLRNVLHWSPGNDTPDGTHFSVEYVIYGDTTEVGKGKRVRENWRAVQQCTNIVRTWCDLSVETWAEEEGYYARVRATGRKSSSKWAVTKNRFDPKWDTIIGPPLLSVEMEDNSAIITLKGPMRYSPNNDTPPLSMKAIYPQMFYNLSVYNTHRKLMHHFPLETSQYKYQLLDYNTEYCFFAKSKFISIPAQCKSSAWHCIVTPQDPVIEQLQQVVVGIVVPALCICIIVVVSYLLYNYLAGKEQRMPFRLNQLSFHPNPLVFLPDNTKLQVTTIIPDKPPPPCENPSVPAQPRSIPNPRGPEGPMDDSSVVYVGALRCVGDCNKRDVNDDHSAGGYKPQAQRFGQSLVLEPPQTEISTLQTQPQSQRNLALQWPVQSNHRSVSHEQTKENDVQSSALRFDKSPKTGQFTVHLNPPLLKEEAKREEPEGGEQKLNPCENVPLLPPYASQNIPTMPSVSSQQPNNLSDDYGVLAQPAAQKAEAGNVKGETMEGAWCSNWNPETVPLVQPCTRMGFNNEERPYGPQPLEKGAEDKRAGNCDESYVTRSQLKLESVILRQNSEMEAGQQVEEEAGSEVDDPFSKWNLKLSELF
uniref:Interleukin 20 receptor, alpha n=1 Tax=Fundulus heteroclitus TaxID=8078 RepID=A0A146Y5N4_FUNHE